MLSASSEQPGASVQKTVARYVPKFMIPSRETSNVMRLSLTTTKDETVCVAGAPPSPSRSTETPIGHERKPLPVISTEIGSPAPKTGPPKGTPPGKVQAPASIAQTAQVNWKMPLRTAKQSRLSARAILSDHSPAVTGGAVMSNSRDKPPRMGVTSEGTST